MKGRLGQEFLWTVGDETVSARVDAKCRLCGVEAITKLHPALLREQTDGTNYVCSPFFGGCNHGFAVPPEVAAIVEDL